MPSAHPSSYAWLSETHLGVAGCVTVVPEAEPAAVAAGFGHDPSDPARGSTEIRVAASQRGTIVFEDNGFEGSRTEVLRVVSKAGGPKLAASLFWNVNGIVEVTCARRGKVVASVDLSVLEEDELTEVPRALRKLARLALDDDADLLAVGAAMVETFAGAGFTEADLAESTVRTIVSRPADLQTFVFGRYEYGPLDHSLPGVEAAVHDLPAERQRALAEWVARAAVRAAGLGQEPPVVAVLGQLGSGRPAPLPPGIDGLKRRAAAESDRLEKLREEEYDEASIEAIERNHAWLPGHALEALRYTSHPDPYSAAVGALASAASAFSCVRTERGTSFVLNASGRHAVSSSPVSHLPAFVDVVRRAVAADPAEWDGLAAQLPEPLSAEELGAAAARDRMLQEVGAFSTWQTGGARHDVVTDGEVAHRAFVERVRERLRSLEERARAMAARGPVSAGPVTAENAGGFAVQLADGLRIERLPVGRAAGRLWLTFVFTHELGFDDGFWDGRRSSPSARVAYVGPDGPLPARAGGGGGGGTVYHWRTEIPTEGLPWARLDYLDAGGAVASETIDLG